ncbi:GTP-binding protein [Nonomuraea sp. N2-4H]|uniref:GTP-binding protein n=1 Tax=Nonomuraea sp. N2-4H TaxID=3128898 RepID=UPI003249E59D
MTTTTTTTRPGLAQRLSALAKVVEHGRGRLDPKLLEEAKALLSRAGDRLKLSSEHTVVALAGGTGSGKSSLFNAISGLELSPTGVRRPTTARTHACVWGLDGSGPLLDWLQIQWRHRFSRASALDKGDSQLHGLILLDLPDHDSIRALTDTEADRLIGLADLVVWVLDPQKYADASTHRRYVTELAGHDAVTVFALNQADRLTTEELAELVIDLNDLLRKEGVEHPSVVPTSAVTGRGIESLKSVIATAVARRRAAIQKLEADLQRLEQKLSQAMPLGEALSVPSSVDEARRMGLTDALCDAVGVPGRGRGHGEHVRRTVEPLRRLAVPAVGGEVPCRPAEEPQAQRHRAGDPRYQRHLGLRAVGRGRQRGAGAGRRSVGEHAPGVAHGRLQGGAVAFPRPPEEAHRRPRRGGAAARPRTGLVVAAEGVAVPAGGGVRGRARLAGGRAAHA